MLFCFVLGKSVGFFTFSKLAVPHQSLRCFKKRRKIFDSDFWWKLWRKCVLSSSGIVCFGLFVFREERRKVAGEEQQRRLVSSFRICGLCLQVFTGNPQIFTNIMRVYFYPLSHRACWCGWCFQFWKQNTLFTQSIENICIHGTFPMLSNSPPLILAITLVLSFSLGFLQVSIRESSLARHRYHFSISGITAAWNWEHLKMVYDTGFPLLD